MRLACLILVFGGLFLGGQAAAGELITQPMTGCNSAGAMGVEYAWGMIAFAVFALRQHRVMSNENTSIRRIEKEILEEGRTGEL